MFSPGMGQQYPPGYSGMQPGMDPGATSQAGKSISRSTFAIRSLFDQRVCVCVCVGGQKRKGKFGAYAMKCVAAGAHLPTPWLFEPAKCPDDRADYCLIPSCLIVAWLNKFGR